MLRLKGWKTVIVNGLTVVIAAVAWPEVVAMVDPQVLLLISAIANIGLRLLTTTKVGSKE